MHAHVRYSDVVYYYHEREMKATNEVTARLPCEPTISFARARARSDLCLVARPQLLSPRPKLVD